MKTTLVLLMAGVLGASGAVTINIDYASATPGDPLDGFDDWAQSPPNSDPLSPLSWVGIHAGRKAASIGGWYDEAPGYNKVFVEHPLHIAADGLNLALDFGVIPSTPFYPEQNDFGIALVDKYGNDIFTMTLTGVGPQWNLGWSSSLIAPDPPPFAGVLPGGDYTYLLHIKNDKASFSIHSDLNSAVGGVVIPGLSGAAVAAIRLDWLREPGEAWGDNVMGVGSITACGFDTPEPNAIGIVASLLGGALMLRTRRGAAQ